MRLTLLPSPVTARLSARLSATLAFHESGLEVSWSPAVPGRLTSEELARYRRARARLLRAAAELNGLQLVRIRRDIYGFGIRRAA